MSVVILLKDHIEVLEFHCDRETFVPPFDTKDNVATTHFNGKHLSFGVIITHLKLNIFTVSFKFHGPPISNKDLDIRYHPHKIMNLLCYSLMENVICVATINKHHYFPMFNKTSDFESLGRKDVSHGME